jgi:hypothetical protein
MNPTNSTNQKRAMRASRFSGQQDYKIASGTRKNPSATANPNPL